MANIKPILDSTQISLEKEAADRFGAAVEDFSRGFIGPALGLPPPLANEQIPFDRNDGSFYATSYAHALAGGTSYRPKLKFLFKVEFVFTAEAMSTFPHILRDSSNGHSPQDFTFMVKSVDRPKIDFEYEDDVNMYNFRTKVLKKIRHRELTISFLDDAGNRVLNFFRALMMIYSPITRRQLQRENMPGDARLDAPTAEHYGSGMQFTPPASVDKNDISMRGVVNEGVGNLIQTIRIKQIYVNPGSNINSATEEVIFDFLNARLVSFDLDDMNHEASEANVITMQFDYDWMEIVTVGPLAKMDGPQYNIAVPGVGGAPVDLSVTGGASDSGGRGNPFLNILTNQFGRATQQVTSEAVSRGVRAVAGNGRFASLLGSHASNIAGGLLGAAARDPANLLGSLNQATARPAGASNSIHIASNFGSISTNVIDSAEGGPANVISVTKSNEDDGFNPQAGP